MTPVHPRVCGELCGGLDRPPRSAGSSPRVRGTRTPLIQLCPSYRFIPACAGNSQRTRTWPSRMTVHPRVCGELVRHPRWPVGHLRFIPACAGNSGRMLAAHHAAPVHPRVCGELATVVYDAFESTRFIPACAGNSRPAGYAAGRCRGSSPRVRGTRCARALSRVQRRFIPACAGNSACFRSGGFSSTGSSPRVRGTRCREAEPADRGPVHPRVCGELHGAQGQGVHQDGSSPRVRGTQHRQARYVDAHRFIPACAGNSIVRAAVKPQNDGSSPRVRGTPILSGLRAVAMRFIPACAGNSALRACGCHHRPGSSPRVRGTLGMACHGLTKNRFIPACAGNSHGYVVRRAHPSVHPRVCGELNTTSRSRTSNIGSSPRVRGTRVQGRPPDCQGRFIPACAGNSYRAGLDGDEMIGSSPRVRGTPPPNRGGTGCCAVHPRVCGELGRHPRWPVGHRRFIPACAGNSSRSRVPPRRLRRFIPACAGNSTMMTRLNEVRAGSSPRVRGTPRSGRRQTLPRRFIPACAGNSEPSLPCTSHSTVHPRVCGELALGARMVRSVNGSSPRVRGTLPASQSTRSVRRFIPACAGNSILR